MSANNPEVLKVEIEAVQDSVRDLEFRIENIDLFPDNNEEDLIVSRRRAMDRLRHLRTKLIAAVS